MEVEVPLSYKQKKIFLSKPNPILIVNLFFIHKSFVKSFVFKDIY